MPQFLDPLYIKEISDSVFQVCDHDFRYLSDVAAQIITVPVGFYTDFASVPRFVPLMYALLGDTAHEPAVIHDWLYYSALVPRDIADRVLLEAMKYIGIPYWRSFLIYAGVRVGGWKAWNEHRKAGHPEAGRFSDTPDIANK